MRNVIINHHGNVEEVRAQLPIIERLTRTPVMPVNPDGPKAARIITDLYEALELCVAILHADNRATPDADAALAKARGE